MQFTRRTSITLFTTVIVVQLFKSAIATELTVVAEWHFSWQRIQMQNLIQNTHGKVKSWWLTINKNVVLLYYTYKHVLLNSFQCCISAPTGTWKITTFKLSRLVRFINCTRSTLCKLTLDCLSQVKYIDNDTSTLGFNFGERSARPGSISNALLSAVACGLLSRNSGR